MLSGVCACVQIIYRNMVNLWFFWVWSLKDFPSNKKAWPPEAKKFTQWEEKKTAGRKMNWELPEEGPTTETIPLLGPHKAQRKTPQRRWGPRRFGDKGTAIWELCEQNSQACEVSFYSRPRLSVMGWIASYPKRCVEVLTRLYLRMWPYLERGSLQMQFKMSALTRTQPHGHPELSGPTPELSENKWISNVEAT